MQSLARKSLLPALAAALLETAILVAAAPYGSGPAPSTNATPRPVVMVTDIGVEVDDQWALAHLLLSPELDVRAIITTHAASLKFSPHTAHSKASEVASAVAKAPAIVEGADGPLADERTARSSRGVALLLELSRQYSESDRLIVLVTGAATELASAIVTDPSIARRISVVAMGFEDWTSADEFNVKNDPAAWRVVLRSDVPLVIGSATLAKRDLRMTRGEAAALIGAHGPLGRYLYDLLDSWLSRESALAAKLVAPDTWAIWDEVVVADVLGMASGESRPRADLQPNLAFAHPATQKRFVWLDTVDRDRVWRDVAAKIDAVRQPRQRPLN